MSSITNPVVYDGEMKRDERGIGGHPSGLTTLFFTELWERFSYYGMRALLVLYMVTPVASGGLELATERATFIYGLYTASVYFTAVPGGLIADRFLGTRLAVLIGGIIIALGHFTMILSSMPFFYGGMVMIALGTGLLKPNISAMVGGLYSEDDPRRDGGFSIFYVGINLGAMIAPIICGYLAQSAGFKQQLTGWGLNPNSCWHWGFGAAGIGMTLGVIQYLWQQKRIAHVGGRPVKPASDNAQNSNDKANKVGVESTRLTREEWQRIGAIGILFIFTVIFFATFEQSGSSLTLFADRLTSHQLFGYEFPSSWFQSINSIFILILAPIFAVMWLKLGHRAPSSPIKFMLGLLFVSFGFLLLVPASMLSAQGKVSPLWLVALYLLHTIGELCLSPVGLSTVTKLAPKRLVGLMMGVWFLAASIGNFFSGWVAGYFNADSVSSLVKLFGGVTVGLIIASIILVCLTPSIRRLMGKVK